MTDNADALRCMDNALDGLIRHSMRIHDREDASIGKAGWPELVHINSPVPEGALFPHTNF